MSIVIGLVRREGILELSAKGSPVHSRSVDSTVETLEGDRVRLTVAVAADEFETAVDAAFHRMSKGLRLPGFRPGKAPRRVVEARIGSEAGRQEALEYALPDYYGKALVQHEVDAIGHPEIKITGGIDAGTVTFDAVVPVRPQPRISGHENIRVEVPSTEPTSEEVEAQLEALRSQLATLEPVEGQADRGDLVTIDVEATCDDEPVPGLNATDYLYEVGSGAVVPELDDHLVGVSAGEELEFEAAHPDGEGQLFFFALSEGRSDPPAPRCGRQVRCRGFRIRHRRSPHI